ncbi:MAG: hypothetical protein ABEH78_08405 [Haloferacaceae archaeon]
MGTSTTAADPCTVRDRRRVDVSDLRAEGVAAYARHQPGTEFYLERRGDRTYLVAADR